MITPILLGVIAVLLLGIGTFAIWQWRQSKSEPDALAGIDTTAMAPEPERVPVQVRVTGTDVRLRTLPSATDNCVFTDRLGAPVHPAKGDVLDCYGIEKDFYHVSYGGRNDLYITREYAEPLYSRVGATTKKVGDKRSGTPRRVKVIGTDVRLRIAPDYDDWAVYTDWYGDPIHPSKGEVLDCDSEERSFYRVNYYGNYLYISKKYADPLF